MRKVLVVDDDEDICLQLSTALKAAGYDVETATSPEEGVERISSWHPELVVLDVMMPSGMEGFDVLWKIRKDLGERDLPAVVVLTAYCTSRDAAYRFAPDDDYLPVARVLDKPVPPSVLVETVQKVLGDYRIPTGPLC